jgi:hypothetical protein
MSLSVRRGKAIFLFFVRRNREPGSRKTRATARDLSVTCEPGSTLRCFVRFCEAERFCYTARMSNEAFDGSKIDEILDLTRENNRILRSMHRRMLWSQVMTFLYWCVILGIAGWSYYLLQPYIVKYLNMYETISKSIDAMDQGGKTLPSNLGNLLDKVR